MDPRAEAEGWTHHAGLGGLPDAPGGVEHEAGQEDEHEGAAAVLLVMGRGGVCVYARATGVDLASRVVLPTPLRRHIHAAAPIPSTVRGGKNTHQLLTVARE